MDGGRYYDKHTLFLDDLEITAYVTWEYTPDSDDEQGGWEIAEISLDEAFDEALTEDEARGIWKAIWIDGPDYSTMTKVDPDFDGYGDQRL